ncbi:MAG: hypothetical protein GXO77_16990 [Calditrichaeota bacterium]|nr:hypothetical protein [Calditrichota bacterium]
MISSRTLGIFSILSAIAYLIVGITHFLMPPEQIHFAQGITADFFLSLSKNAAAFHFHYWAFVIASLLAMGVFLGAGIGESPSYLFKITRMWALLGFAITVLDFSRMHSNAIRLASEFLAYSGTVKASVLAHGLDRLDPYGIAFSLIGIHIFYLNFSGGRSRRLPEWMAFIGMSGGVLLQFVFIGSLTHIGLMIDLAAGLGGVIIFPLWLIAYGLWHLKTKREDNRISGI